MNPVKNGGITRSPEHVDDVVKRSSQDCIVKELTEVSDAVWPSLAESQRFPLTYDNVKTYISAMDGFDVNLANFMEDTTQITEVPQDDEEGKKSLATEILRGATIIPSAATRVKLIKSLSLSETIDLETLPEEDGEIFGTLVANKLIEDDEEVYRHLAERSWSTREYFIINSSGFKEYMTPDLLTDDLGNILESARVNQETKRKIIKDIDSSIIKEVTTFDVYQGENIPKDKKSVAINVSLQALDKTLSEKDLDQISKKIIDIVKDKTGATIRS